MKEFTEIIKAKYGLKAIPFKNKEIPSFDIYGGKRNFRLNKLWCINGFHNSAFLVSYRTKYDILISGGPMSYLTAQSDENHLSIVVESSINFPNLVLRPRKIADFIAHSTSSKSKRLKNELKFNLKYIVDSDADINRIALFRNSNFIALLIAQQNFWFEIMDSHFTFHFQNGISMENINNLLKIAEYIDKSIVNAA